MKLIDMIVAVVYQSSDGLNPIQIVELISRQYLTQTTSKQVLDIVERNPKLFVEIEGKIKSPSPPTSEETYKILK
jgi:hypothetical protein